MANRRRRPRVVWLPLDRTNHVKANPATAGTDSSLFTYNLGGVGGGFDVSLSFPVVGDSPFNLALSGSIVGPSLSDVEDSGYRLRRIVGKLFVGFDQIDSGPSEIAVTAGFIILRTGPDGFPLAAPGGIGGFYDPASLDNQADPWIWRRTWLLSNPSADPNIRLPLFPANNTQYGSVADGPHIDQKTARIVGPEERLFICFKIVPTVDSADQTQGFVEIVGDYRVLASMRTNVGNRRNASR